MVIFNVKNKNNTHIAGDKAGSFNEGVADLVDVPKSRARQVTETHRQTAGQSH